jgi:hypothetical protein
VPEGERHGEASHTGQVGDGENDNKGYIDFQRNPNPPARKMKNLVVLDKSSR